jgi:hypothetical protein
MPQKCETPLAGGASRNSCGGQFRDCSSPLTFQTQFIARTFGVRSVVAATLAELAFGGAGNE